MLLLDCFFAQIKANSCWQILLQEKFKYKQTKVKVNSDNLEVKVNWAKQKVKENLAKQQKQSNGNA